MSAPPSEPVARRPPDAPGDADPTPPPPIVFVGGTGRSGTHAVALLLGRHSRYADVPIEARFHANSRGLPDLLAGQVTVDEFVRKLRRFWWYRVAAGEPLPAVLPRLRLGRSTRGLYQVVPRPRFERAIARFERRFPRKPEAASRRLYLDLLWPVAERAGKAGLVEMTTATVAAAPTLARLFPEARFVHCVRDGRDTGSSKVAKRVKADHPRDAFDGLAWWRERLEGNERGIGSTPPGRILQLSLDELAAGAEDRREAAYRSLLGHLGIDDEASIREHFEAEITSQNANRGRWRRALSEPQQAELTRRYEQILAELEEAGAASAPILRDVHRRLG